MLFSYTWPTSQPIPLFCHSAEAPGSWYKQCPQPCVLLSPYLWHCAFPECTQSLFVYTKASEVLGIRVKCRLIPNSMVGCIFHCCPLHVWFDLPENQPQTHETAHPQQGLAAQSSSTSLVLYKCTETKPAKAKVMSQRNCIKFRGGKKILWVINNTSASQTAFPSTITPCLRAREENISAGTAETKVHGGRKTVLTSEENYLSQTSTVTKYKSFRVHMQFYQSGINQKYLEICVFQTRNI